MAKYDKNLCLKNLYSLAEKKNLKISELEKCGGMSTGFLSRAKKSGNTAKLPLEGIVAIAEKLEVPLDLFISVDLSSVSETDKYQLDLLNKLLDETIRGVLDWKVDTLQHMQSVGDCDYDENIGTTIRIDHMLYKYHEEADVFYYDGIANEDEYTNPIPHGDYYHAVIANGLKVYLADVEYDVGDSEKKVASYELWLCLRNKNGAIIVEGICSSVEAKSIIAEKIEMLHTEISKSIGSRHLSHQSRKMIEMYING